MAWEYLLPQDRRTLLSASPIMMSYAMLRMQASVADLSPLLHPRPPPDASPIDESRVELMGCAFLRCNCDYGDFIRWLGGPYTDAHRDWDDTFATLESVRDCPPPDQFPVPDYERTFRACTEGVPLKANYLSDFTSAEKRNSSPLSPDLVQNEGDVDETLRKEEKLSYHILMPRFLWRFFGGLLLSIFRVAYRWGDPKPRLCVDPSTTLAPDDVGNVNRQIPDPGVDEDESPTIFYGTAFMRYLTWIWNLRISYPQEDILQMTDDISAAFHRVLYHPDIAPAFATVWKTYVVLPVSAIFGGRNSPGTYMWKGEMRSHLANFVLLPESAYQESLVTRIVLPPQPTADDIALFSQALPDALNPGIAFRPDGSPERRHPSFVDDTGVAHIRRHFLTAAAASVFSAYVVFGRPEEDPARPPCINPAKWSDNVFHYLQFLGYHIDTRKMTVAWPLDKRAKLSLFLGMILDDETTRHVTPHTISRVLGLIRHASPVAPMGSLRSLQLQHHFNDVLSKAPSVKLLRRWYQRKSIQLPDKILLELRLLRSKLSGDILDPYWCRPIGLLVPRRPTVTVFTDASTNALGGWSRLTELNHMWRITVQDLVDLGIPSTTIWTNKHNYHEPDIDPLALHINILEFFAIFIELWICLRQLFSAHSRGEPSTTSSEAPAESIPPGGHRLLARADNTSALSWLRYATRTKRPPVRRLARILTAFLSHPFAASFVRVQGKHLAGIVNVSADHLSRFERSASWAAVMANCPNLRHLRICLIPRELLLLLVSVYLQEQTEAWYETAMTALWTIESPVFVTGSQRPVDTTTSVVPGA
jgi:hypothetical protein